MAVAEIPYPGAGSVIDPTYPYRLDADSQLQVASACSTFNITLAVQGRKIDETGQNVPFAFTHAPTNTRLVKTDLFPIGPGALVSLTIFATGAITPGWAQCYVRANLVQGTGLGQTLVANLAGGYVTAHNPLAFPGTPIRSSLEFPPAILEIPATVPPPGSQVFQTVPTNTRWELLSFFGQLTTSAAVATREVFLVLDRSADIMAILNSPATIAAGVVTDFLWAPDLQPFVVAGLNFQQAALPVPCLLTDGQDFRTLVINMQAADAWSVPIFRVKEWLEVP